MSKSTSANSNPPLSLTGTFEKAEIVTSPTITEERDKAVELARKVPPILKTEKDAAAAVEAKRICRDIRKAVEVCRKVLKAPLDKLGKDLLRREEKFLEDLVAEEGQLDGKINNWQRKQLDLNRQQTEQAKVELVKELTEAEKLRAEITQKECELEYAGRFGDFEAVEKLEDEILGLRLALENAPTEEQLASLTLPVTSVAGISGRQILDFEIKGRDEREKLDNLHAFAQAYPELVKMEIKRKAVLDKLNTGDCFRSTFPEEQPMPPDWLPNPPGLRVFRNVTSQVR